MTQAIESQVGELLAEYAAGAAPTSPQKEYGYRNGELLVTASGGGAQSVAPINLALGKTTNQSSTLVYNPPGDAWHAVDGNTDGTYFNASVTHTNGDSQPWWQLDLGGVQSITNIDLWNRTDCCADRLSNFYVFVSDVPFTSTDPAATQGQAGVWSLLTSGQAPIHSTVPINRTGRYVRVQLAGAGILSLAEVQVWGMQDLSLGQAVSQSSTLIYTPPGDAWHAVDGNTDGNYFNASVTHTNGENQPWWQVDLGSARALDRVTLWNRTDCCADRLSNFYVFVSDIPFTSTDPATTQAQAGVWTLVTPGQAAVQTTVPINRTGRYVRVQLAGAGCLSLAEVQVWGANSMTQSQAADVRWLVTDQLGTPRIILDQTGSLANVSRHDYLPFGEEVPGGFRSGIPGYSTGDNVRQKFTQKERDNETGLDWFETRYFSSTQGRFTSVDPLMASGRLPSPQTWNRYTYSLNNPLRFTDPGGMIPGDYYNQEGKRLGTDGINDKKVYVVTNDAQAKQIQKTDKQGGTTQVSAVSSAVELPGYDVRQAISAAVDRSNAPSGLDKEGGNHEEGLQWGKNASGHEQIVDAAPGAYSDVQTATRATVDTGVAANTAQQGAITTLEGTAHVHPKAEVVTGPGPGVVFGGTTTTRNWVQQPSAVDISNAGNRPGTTNIVVGARDKKVYVYDGTGTKATFPLKQFRSIK